MPKHPQCDMPGPHRPHDFVIVVAEQTGDTMTAMYGQVWCPGEPWPEPPEPPLHGHGDGPHPNACWECFTEGLKP